MYETFKTELIAVITKKLEAPYKVETYKAFKNGKEIDAFTIKQKDTQATPTFYFKNFLEDYRNGSSVADIAEDVLEMYFFAAKNSPINIDECQDFNVQKSNICYKVVNKEAYKDQLPSIPHIDFFDLAIILYSVLSINDKNEMSFIVTNDMVKVWNTTPQELFILATKNTPRLFPINITSLNALMFQFDIPQYETISDTIENLPHDYVYAITNEYSRNGFAGIFYPGVLKCLGKRFGNFYLLPSSIHEALIIPEGTDMSPQQLMEMVHGVNTEVVSPDEYLSDSVYQYSVENDRLDAYLNTCITEK